MVGKRQQIPMARNSRWHRQRKNTLHVGDPASASQARSLIHRCRTAGVLLFDDFGKERKLSSAVASATHDLLEDRARNCRTTLWTSEKTGVELAQRLGDDYADGIIRRLREFSQIIAA